MTSNNLVDDFSKTRGCQCACVHITASYQDLSVTVSLWSSSKSHQVDMFESARGIVSAIGTELTLLLQVDYNYCRVTNIS